MAVYKEEKTGTWRVIYRYTDWTGEKKQTQKRGFQTKREAQAWEREQLNKARADLDMTFKSFVEQYTADMQTRIKENTWATKEHNAKGLYAFQSTMWKNMNFRKIMLTKIYRQNNVELVEKLHAIKYGNLDAVQWFNDNTSPFFMTDGVTICPTNKLVEQYNHDAWSMFSDCYMEEYCPTIISGTLSEIPQSHQSLQLAVGMRIMTTSNGKTYKNGSMGTVTKLNKKSIRVKLDIDAHTDVRFIKNGISALDALCAYYVEGGGFKHIPNGNLDGMATEQSYYALAAYFRMLDGKTALYDMTDVIDMGGDVTVEEPVETLPAETEPAPTEPMEMPAENGRSFPWWLVIVIVVLTGAIVVLLIIAKPKKGKHEK